MKSLRTARRLKSNHIAHFSLWLISNCTRNSSGNLGLLHSTHGQILESVKLTDFDTLKQKAPFKRSHALCTPCLTFWHPVVYCYALRMEVPSLQCFLLINGIKVPISPKVFLTVFLLHCCHPVTEKFPWNSQLSSSNFLVKYIITFEVG